MLIQTCSLSRFCSFTQKKLVSNSSEGCWPQNIFFSFSVLRSSGSRPPVDHLLCCAVYLSASFDPFSFWVISALWLTDFTSFGWRLAADPHGPLLSLNNPACCFFFTQSNQPVWCPWEGYPWLFHIHVSFMFIIPHKVDFCGGID